MFNLVSQDIEEYSEEHTTPESELLYRINRETHLYYLNPRMVSGQLQGAFLSLISRLKQPKHILEIGTFSGYSAICMAEGLETGGKVYTFEIDDELEDFTRPWIEQSPVAERIAFFIGDAITEAPKLGITFDMVFLDGDKRTYIQAYEMALQVTRPGGFILADNTLWDGHVVDAAYDGDAQTRGILAFNDHVSSDQRVEQVILPLRDGLTIVKIKD